MKILILVHADGHYCKGPTVPANFNTQQWANERTKSFLLLKVVRVEEVHI